MRLSTSAAGTLRQLEHCPAKLQSPSFETALLRTANPLPGAPAASCATASRIASFISGGNSDAAITPPYLRAGLLQLLEGIDPQRREPLAHLFHDAGVRHEARKRRR